MPSGADLQDVCEHAWAAARLVGAGGYTLLCFPKACMSMSAEDFPAHGALALEAASYACTNKYMEAGYIVMATAVGHDFIMIAPTSAAAAMKGLVPHMDCQEYNAAETAPACFKWVHDPALRWNNMGQQRDAAVGSPPSPTFSGLSPTLAAKYDNAY